MIANEHLILNDILNRHQVVHLQKNDFDYSFYNTAPQSEVDRVEVLLIKERKREYTTNQKGATSQQARRE